VAGIAAGILSASALGRGLTGMLYRVSAYDPVTYGATAVMALTVAITACAIPAIKVLSIDLIRVLRQE